MFGDICSVKGPYLQKGKRVSVVGSLRQSRWEKDGKKFSRVEILANQIQFLDVSSAQARPASVAAPGTPNAAAPTAPASAVPPEVVPSESFPEDPLPGDFPF